MAVITFQSTYGVIIIQDMTIVSVDDNYARIFGYSDSEDLLAHTNDFLELITEDFHELARSNYLETVSGVRAPQGHTYTNIDRNGKEITVFSIDHLIEWQGKPALQVTIIDLTSTIEIERRSREQNRMYRDMIMTSAQGILVHRNFKPLMVNESWVRMQGADSIQQVLSMDTILPLLPKAKFEKVMQHYQDIVSGNKSGTSTVVENIGLDGVSRFFNIYDNAIDWKGERAVQVVLEDVTEKVALEKQLLHQAKHDEMTDLYNRRAIYEWLDEQLLNQTHLTCMLMDIDDFKVVNDNYGHSVGDLVIKRLANVARERVEAFGGVVGRWGGEEFIAFVPEISCSEIQQIANQICREFNEIEFIDHNHRPFCSSVSIGISDSYACGDNLTVDTLVGLTDKSLYTVKANGKNGVYIDKKTQAHNK